MGSGMAGNAALDTAFGGEGADKLLVKVTAFLATLFMVLSIALNVLSTSDSQETSVSKSSVLQGEVIPDTSVKQDTTGR